MAAKSSGQETENEDQGHAFYAIQLCPGAFPAYLRGADIFLFDMPGARNTAVSITTPCRTRPGGAGSPALSSLSYDEMIERARVRYLPSHRQRYCF